MDRRKTKLIHSLICMACKELLFEPVTLPCGYSLCLRCYRLPKSCLESACRDEGDSQLPDFRVTSYRCPIKTCRKLHQHRREKQNFLLHSLLLQLFPSHQKALIHNKAGEEKLTKYWNPSPDLCKNVDAKCDALQQEKRQALAQMITEHFDVAIAMAPCLQLPYITRCKAKAELGLYDEAFADAKRAHQVNHANKRGEAAFKIIEWRRSMHESQNDTLAECALHVIRNSHTFESDTGPTSICDLDVAESVKTAACQLRSELVDIMKSKEDDQWSTSTTKLVETMQSVNLGDLECHICLGAMYDAVTCPCGHTWCRSCLFETLTQSKECPMCRCQMPSIGYFLKRPVDYAVNAIIKYFTTQEEELVPPPEQVSAETSSCFLAPFRIPLFVCSLVVPNATEGFHMFEPRYRALIKRCLEGNREFGAVLPSTTSESDGSLCCEYGTVLRITHSEALVHGDFLPTAEGDLPRFIIETIGMYRFKILSVEMTEAGYLEGLVQRIEDIEPEDSDPNDWNPVLLSQLCTEAREFVFNMMQQIPHSIRPQFERRHGRMPEDPYDLSFWLAKMLPLNPYTTYTLLPLTSCVERLQILCAWIRRAFANCPRQ
ncbi:hypothetical protein HDV03_002406 [Kappamyces sp. JEL0829]|nr:hypothetical protein HDV03_002406 [Kappamyces sp. JEL0829]